LISDAASLTPSRIETPMGLEPPVYGPDKPILIGSAAKAEKDAASAKAVTAVLILMFIILSSSYGKSKTLRIFNDIY